MSDGVVVFEAEDFSAVVSRGGHQWQVTNSISGFSGAGFMVATPDTGAVLDVSWTNASPELQYDVVFNPAATYYIWIRGYPTSGLNDSVHAGLDGQTGAADRIVWTNYGGWAWTRGTGTPASVSVASTGLHTFSLWMREDGAAIDRIVLTTNANFMPTNGNAWHIPNNTQPAGYTMRWPASAIYSNTPVLIFNGNQYTCGGAQGNQLQIGSTIYYKHATATVWNTLPMYFHGTTGCDIHYSNAIPADTFRAGDVVQYYLKIPYSEYLPTFLYESNATSYKTDMESTAQTNPFSYTVLGAPTPRFASPDDWRDQNIYFIFMDRFFDGDPANNNVDPEQSYNPTNSRGIHGGDFKGIERKLDYIRALGANAIWITPIPKNVGSSSYHGYGAHDFNAVAPHWGTQADLSNMVASAHAKGIRVVLDIVANHAGNRINSGDSGYPTYKDAGYNLRWSNATN
ncbi:MAG TPA: alpha-amylase family glycosyl hydrolase, partial [Kiritimatiellia bacterium]